MDDLKQNLGANLDTRSEERKAKDFHFKEAVSAPAPVAWIDKDPTSWGNYPIRNQDGSSSCVAQTMAKMVGILHQQAGGVFPVLSAASIYNRRTNKPAEGMIGVEAFDIARTQGLTLEALLPSQNLTEAQIQARMEKGYEADVAKVFRIGGFLQFDAKDFDSVASTLNFTNKPIMVWFEFGSGEWNDVPTLSAPTTPNRHSVTAIPNSACIYQGKKGFVIEDSWGKFGMFDGQRFITEDFFRKRNLFSAYPINLKVSTGEKGEKPSFPLVDVIYGFTTPQAKQMQDFLKWDGCFPFNIESTGYYGAITARAVKAFGVKYGIALTEASGRKWGASERAQAQIIS